MVSVTIDSVWRAAWTVSPPLGMYNLQNRRMALTRARLARSVVAVTSPKQNTYIFDLAYNAAGACSFTVSSAVATGTKIKFVHGEILDAEGNIVPSPATSSRRDPSEGRINDTSSYIVAGDGIPEAYQPKFVYYGFRYVQVVTPVPPTQLDMQCSDVSTDLEAVGSVTFAGGVVNEVSSLR